MAKLYFRKSGTGQRVLVMFHGFGQDHSVFAPLTQALKKEVTCYAFDIYYHGRSEREDKFLTPEEWKNEFNQFLHSEQVVKFDLVGFSLGGRFAIATSILFPDRINHVVLIAPDGIFRSAWYRIANSPPGNKLFSYLMDRPDYFFHFLRIVEHLKIIPASLVKFARYSLADPSNRTRIYKTWTYFRKLQYSRQEIAQHFNESDQFLHVILGKKDTIIPLSRVQAKLRGIRIHQFHTLLLPHHVLIEKSEEIILSILHKSA